MSNFVPLTTWQGYSTEELRSIVGNRNPVIWGAGFMGRMIARTLIRYGLNATAFCDRNESLQGQFIDDLPVIHPDLAMADASSSATIIIIANAGHRRAIQTECENAGLTRKRDFISYLSLARPEAVIEVSGDYDVTRPAYPQAHYPDMASTGQMSLADFRAVLLKLAKDLPLLSRIDLSGWGEPFLNPDLPEMVRLAEAVAPVTLTTNLQSIDQLSDLLAAGPSQLVVSVSGYEDSYERHHGGNWSKLLEHLRQLAQLKDQYESVTEVRVLYHLHADNGGDDLERMKMLLEQLGLVLVTTVAYLNPYDQLLLLAEGNELSEPMQRISGNLAWDLGKTMQVAKRQIGKACLCQRIFPIVSADLSVSLCHLYEKPRIASDYRDFDIEELVAVRHNTPNCITCQKHGLHRLDLDVLTRQYPEEPLVNLSQ